MGLLDLGKATVDAIENKAKETKEWAAETAPETSAATQAAGKAYHDQIYNTVLASLRDKKKKKEEPSTTQDVLISQIQYLLSTDHATINAGDKITSVEKDGFARVTGFLTEMQAVAKDDPTQSVQLTKIKQVVTDLSKGDFKKLVGLLQSDATKGVALTKKQKTDLLTSIEIAASKKPNFEGPHATIKLVKDNFAGIQALFTEATKPNVTSTIAIINFVKIKGVDGLNLIDKLRHDPNIVNALPPEFQAKLKDMPVEISDDDKVKYAKMIQDPNSPPPEQLAELLESLLTKDESQTTETAPVTTAQPSVAENDNTPAASYTPPIEEELSAAENNADPSSPAPVEVSATPSTAEKPVAAPTAPAPVAVKEKPPETKANTTPQQTPAETEPVAKSEQPAAEKEPNTRLSKEEMDLAKSLIKTTKENKPLGEWLKTYLDNGGTLDKLGDLAKKPAFTSLVPPNVKPALAIITDYPNLKPAITQIIQGGDAMEVLQKTIAASKDSGKTMSEVCDLLANSFIQQQLPADMRPVAELLAKSKAESGIIAAVMGGKPLNKPLQDYLNKGGTIAKLSELAKNSDLAGIVPADKKAILEQFATLDPKYFAIIEAKMKGDNPAFAKEATQFMKARLDALASKNNGVVAVSTVKALLESAPEEMRKAFSAQVNAAVKEKIDEKKLEAVDGDFNLDDPKTQTYALTEDTPASENIKFQGKVLIPEGERLDWALNVAKSEIRPTKIDGVPIDITYGRIDLSKLALAKTFTPDEWMGKLAPELEKTLGSGAKTAPLTKEQLVAFGMTNDQAALASSFLGDGKPAAAPVLADKTLLTAQQNNVNEQIDDLETKYKDTDPKLAATLRSLKNSITAMVTNPATTQEQADKQVKDVTDKLAKLEQSEAYAKEALDRKKAADKVNAPINNLMASVLGLISMVLNVFVSLGVSSLKPLADRVKQGADAFQNGDIDKLAMLDGKPELTKEDVAIAQKKGILNPVEAEGLEVAIKLKGFAPMLTSMVNTMGGVMVPQVANNNAPQAGNSKG